jgi:hypothetical protein
MKLDPNAPAGDLTIRGHLAAAAMIGILSRQSDPDREGTGPMVTAEMSVEYADALIAELNEGENQ